VSTGIQNAVARERQKRAINRVANGIQARIQSNLFSDIDEVCRLHDVRGPGGFLAEVMAGVDPRSKKSRALALVDEIEARGATSMPTEEEWFELADLIKNDPRYDKEPISLDNSQRAAEKLLPVVYKTSSAVEVAADVQLAVSPLSREECDVFDQWFREKYGSTD